MLAVMDAAGSEKAAIFAQLDAGPSALLFAARYPDRVTALILGNTFARYRRAADYPYGFSDEAADMNMNRLAQIWGTTAGAEALVPSKASDKRYVQRYAKWMRSSAKPHVFLNAIEVVLRADVRDAVPLVGAPTLVIQRSAFPILTLDQAQYLASKIPSARFLELPGRDAAFFSESADEVLDHIEEFVTGSPPTAKTDRILAAVLFTDIVDSTGRAASVGDQLWRNIIQSHDALAGAIVEQHRGRLVKTTGDGVLATFDGPGRAIQCASAMRDALRPLGIEIRAGLHTGEVELIGNDIGGLGVHVARRVLDHAAPGEILTSAAVPMLVAGSGLQFADRGTQALKGVPGEWQLFSVLQ
jgi:class 3 adenylate cyclase